MHIMAKDMHLHDVVLRLRLDLVQFMEFKKVYDQQKQAHDHFKAQIQHDLQHQICQRNVDEYDTVDLCTNSIENEDMIKGIQFLKSRDEFVYPTQLPNFTGSRYSFLEIRGMDDIDGVFLQEAINNGIRHQYGDLTAHSLQWLTDQVPDTKVMQPMRQFVQELQLANASVGQGNELVNSITDRRFREASPQVLLSDPFHRDQRQDNDELPQRSDPDPKGKRVALAEPTDRFNEPDPRFGQDALQPAIDHGDAVPPDVIRQIDDIMREFRESNLPWDQFFPNEPNFELPVGQTSTATVQQAQPGENGPVAAVHEQDRQLSGAQDAEVGEDGLMGAMSNPVQQNAQMDAQDDSNFLFFEGGLGMLPHIPEEPVPGSCELTQEDIDRILGDGLDMPVDAVVWPAIEADVPPCAANECVNPQDNAWEAFVDLTSFPPTNSATLWANNGQSELNQNVSPPSPAIVGDEVEFRTAKTFGSALDSNSQVGDPMRDLEGQLQDATRANSNAELVATGLATFGERYDPNEARPMFPVADHNAFGGSFQGDFPEQPFSLGQMFKPLTLAQQLFPEGEEPTMREQDQPFRRHQMATTTPGAPSASEDQGVGRANTSLNLVHHPQGFTSGGNQMANGMFVDNKASNTAGVATNQGVPTQAGTHVLEASQTADLIFGQRRQSGASAPQQPVGPRTAGHSRGRPRKVVFEDDGPFSDDRVLMDSDEDFHGVYVPIGEMDDDDYKPLPKRGRKTPSTGRKRTGPQMSRSNATPRKRKTAADSLATVGPLSMHVPVGFVSAPGDNAASTSADTAQVAPSTEDTSTAVAHAVESAPMPVAAVTIVPASVLPTGAFRGPQLQTPVARAPYPSALYPSAPDPSAQGLAITKKGQGRKRKIAVSSMTNEGMETATTAAEPPKTAKRVSKKAAGVMGEPRPPKRTKFVHIEPLPAQNPAHAASGTSYSLPQRPQAVNLQEHMKTANATQYEASQMPSNAIEPGQVPLIDGRPIVKQVSYPRPEGLAPPSAYDGALYLPQLPSVDATYRPAQATSGGPPTYDAQSQVAGTSITVSPGWAAAGADISQLQASADGISPTPSFAAQGSAALNHQTPAKRGRGRPPGSKTKKRKTSALGRAQSIMPERPVPEIVVSQPYVVHQTTAANDAGQMATNVNQQLAHGSHAPPSSVSAGDLNPDLIDPQLSVGVTSGDIDQPSDCANNASIAAQQTVGLIPMPQADVVSPTPTGRDRGSGCGGHTG